MKIIQLKRLYAWFVHFFTASGAVFSVFAIIASVEAYAAKITNNENDFFFYIKLSFVYTAIAVVIDSVDGTLARKVNIKNLASLDGALLDNIIDFVNYAVTPSIWIFIIDVVPDKLKMISLIMIILASCYQFCQINAKTKDNFFKGFPSYWNLTIYYLIYFNFLYSINFVIITVLFILTFIPIKYIYPSRMSHVSNNKYYIVIIFIYTLVWGIGTIVSIIIWPSQPSQILNWLVISYFLFYFGLSIYRTIKPIRNYL